MAHTRVLGSFVSRSIGGGGFIETALPFFGGHGVTALPMWRPARRLTTAGMSKSDVRRVFAERGKAYQNTAVAASGKSIKQVFRYPSPELDLREEDERDGGEHERRDELEAGRGLCRAEQACAEEIGGKDDREVDERHEGAEKRTEEQHLHGGWER